MAKNNFDELMSIGVDIGKDVFHLVGFIRDGERVLRKKIKRHQLEQVVGEFPRCIVGMEVCLRVVSQSFGQNEDTAICKH